jgi:choline dehydrogenase-like flavoprotein
MSTSFSEILAGTLTRSTGPSDSFSCTLDMQAPDSGATEAGGLTLPIGGGSVDWAYLGISAQVTGGSVELFKPSPSAGDPVTTNYNFEFTAENATYSFRGEKRFSGANATTELTSVYASVEGAAGALASGVLSSQLDDLLQAYDGVLADGPQGTPDVSPGRLNLHNFVNRSLSAIFPHLPTTLATGRTIPDGLSKILRLLAEVLLPTPLPASGPSIDDVVGGIEKFLAASSAKQVQTIRTLLSVISLFAPILNLEVTEIRRLVAGVFANEKNSLIRQALSGIHQIVAFAYYANPKADGLLCYARPVHIAEHKTRLPVSASIPDRVFDVVIAGTGPAGSLLADRLSSRGKSVLLLEGGAYIAEQDITTDELTSIARLYKMSGLQTSTAPSSITVLQGACVGGGGVINNGIFFPLAASTLVTWRNAGFPFDDDTMARAYSAVAGELNIGDIQEKARRLNPAARYLSQLGNLQAPPFGPVPPGFYRMMVNLETLPPEGEATGCRSTGLCNLGCGSERKVNSFQYYLKNALTGGRDVVLVPQASVREAVMGDGASRHTVTALKVLMADGSTATARGKSFVLCCGPVGSSGVLLRSSGLLSAAGGKLPVGQRFCGNVASPVFAAAPDPVNGQTSVQMCHVFVPPAGDDGFLIETWFSPPGGLALAMPGYLDAHEQRMNQYQHLVSASPVIGTQPIGRITLKGDDTAIDLPLAPVDLDRMRRGMKQVVTAFLAGNASPVIVRLGNGRVVSTPAEVDQLDAEMAALTPADLHLLPLSTAHPQGGNAISDDDAIGVVGADFRVRGVDNLRVCDGSVFPGVAGVNPQWTIYALAHLCAANFD